MWVNELESIELGQQRGLLHSNTHTGASGADSSSFSSLSRERANELLVKDSSRAYIYTYEREKFCLPAGRRASGRTYNRDDDEV